MSKVLNWLKQYAFPWLKLSVTVNLGLLVVACVVLPRLSLAGGIIFASAAIALALMQRDANV